MFRILSFFLKDTRRAQHVGRLYGTSPFEPVSLPNLLGRTRPESNDIGSTIRALRGVIDEKTIDLRCALKDHE